MKTQTLLKHFEGFIFSECFDYISDSEFKYEFGEYFIEKKSDAQPSEENSSANPILYEKVSSVSQQTLLESSLAPSIIRYDFTESYEPINREVRSTVSSYERPARNNDAVDSHPCMASMVSVIQYVVEKFVIASTEKDSMPRWMLSMKDFMQFGSVNVKIFIARLLIRLEQIFRPYSSEWFNAVAQLILNDQFGEAGVHYFCFDLLLILVQWISEGHFQPSTTSSKALCNRLLEYCIRYSWSKNYLVQKRNLHLVETMVDILKDVITVDMKILLEHLNLTEIDNENAFGINLLQSVLKNMKKPCKLCDEADNNHHIFLYIINKLSSKHARIYKPAAYVSGLTLHALSETDGGTFRGMLHSAIVKITGTTSDRSKFLLCLSEITKNEASFADSFFAELLTRLPVLHGHLKALCLEIFISFAGRRKDLFVDLKGHGFLETFSSHDHECQLVSVKLLHSLLPQLSVTQIEEVVHVLFSFVKHPLVSCRRRFAELCCSMIDKLSEIHSSSLKAKTAIGSLTEYSLSLLTDREESVRKIVFLWWCDEKRLSFRSAARLESILSLYSHSPGKDFLGQATSFMFDLSSRSPDFSRPLYDRPLEDCNFVDMHVPTHWRSRYAQFEIPTFMSFSKLLEKVSHTHTAQGETEMGLTQSTELSTSAWPLLTPTADEAVLPGSPGKSPETYGSVWNELSGNFELDAAAGMQAAGSDLLPSEHGVPEGSIGRDFKLLKRRILKDAEQKQFYANLRKQQYPRRQRMTAEAVKTKEYEVRLHRTYRRGDFPDIQIPHSAIIATLQAVAQLDGTSAGLLFEAILCGLSERISCDKQRGDSVNFFRAVSARIADIFSSMSNYYRPFVSCVINYLYRFHDFVTFSPQHIAHAALMSGQPDCGIPLLERCVENSDILAPLLKRQKKSFRDSDSREFLESVWICLGRLYKASGGLENLRTIFEEHLKASERTRLALKLEYVGDYEKAISVYTDAMSEIDDSNQNSLYLAETELWEESRLECLNELSDWKHMAFLLPFYGEAGQPQYDEIWKDDYSIDFHLPFLLRSNIKLLMSASDTFREEFTSFIKRSEADEANRKILLDRHAGFLALLNILQRDCVKAKYLTHAAFDTMLMSYPTLRVTDLQARRKVLQNMHVLAEMLGYVELATSGNVTATQISALCSLWENSSTDLRAYATLTVDDLVCNRNLFIDLLVEMAGCKLTVAEEIHPSLAHFKMHYRFQYVKNALHRKNYAAALRQLEEARKISTEDDLLLLELENYEAYSICQIVKNDVVCSEKKMQLFQRAVDLFTSCEINSETFTCYGHLASDQITLKAMLYRSIADCLLKRSKLESHFLERLEHFVRQSVMGAETSVFPSVRTDCSEFILPLCLRFNVILLQTVDYLFCNAFASLKVQLNLRKLTTQGTGENWST